VEKRMFVVREGEEKVWWREEAGDSLFGVVPELLARGKKRNGGADLYQKKKGLGEGGLVYSPARG
jgi:hypothetical protein